MPGWRLESDAAEAEIGARKKLSADKANNELKEMLAPIKKLLDSRIGPNRQVMMAVILEYLSR